MSQPRYLKPVGNGHAAQISGLPAKRLSPSRAREKGIKTKLLIFINSEFEKQVLAGRRKRVIKEFPTLLRVTADQEYWFTKRSRQPQYAARSARGTRRPGKAAIAVDGR
jgi:hypothetical protein